ncbi:MAG: hypothetical protein DMG65_25060 [Candidatus Angelobacter sp. Gp1-AA117]|nr:MAG: hypothetical protein DMG65_25060 [Candidatus Angelobacter sp. Gp1-AA117]
MQQQLPKKVYNDAWGDTRIGYEDKPVFQQRKKAAPRKENKFIGSIGSFLIIGAMCWGVYLVTSNGLNTAPLLKFPGPVHLAGAGVIVSIVSKFLG